MKTKTKSTARRAPKQVKGVRLEQKYIERVTERGMNNNESDGRIGFRLPPEIHEELAKEAAELRIGVASLAMVYVVQGVRAKDATRAMTTAILAVRGEIESVRDNVFLATEVLLCTAGGSSPSEARMWVEQNLLSSSRQSGSHFDTAGPGQTDIQIAKASLDAAHTALVQVARQIPASNAQTEVVGILRKLEEVRKEIRQSPRR